MFLRLADLDAEFTDSIRAEDQFPPELPSMKSLYTHFYKEMTNLTTNLVCASCGCLDHRMNYFSNVPINYSALRHLHVDPSLVPFDFASGIPQLDDLHIMIDTLGAVQPPSSDQLTSLLLCRIHRQHGYITLQTLGNTTQYNV